PGPAIPSVKPIIKEDEDFTSERPQSPALAVMVSKPREALVPEPAVRKVSQGSITTYSSELNAFFKDPATPILVEFRMSEFLPAKPHFQSDITTIKLEIWQVTS